MAHSFVCRETETHEKTARLSCPREARFDQGSDLPCLAGGSAYRSATVLYDSNIAIAQTLTRGPYLQLGTSTSIVIRWRTSVATNSRVRYGASPTSLTNTVDLPAVTTEHIVTLTGLTPDTLYYYSIGSTTQFLAGGDRVIFLLPRRRPGWGNRRVSGSSAIPATGASPAEG